MRIGIVAGEASGDLLGAGLIRTLRERYPDAVFEGIAGPRMIEQGCRALYPAQKLAVMGITEVLGRLYELLRIRAHLLRHFTAHPPDVFIGIDAPDFNLALERGLKRAGIPTVHYVSPSVWAWRRYRVRNIARSVDRMLTLFPFEAAFYAAHTEHPVAARFVGHPLADAIAPPEVEDAALRLRLRREFNLPAEAQVIALLPGSRETELHALAAPFMQAAAWCAAQRPALRFIAPQASALTRKLFEQTLAQHAPQLPVTLIDGRAQDALRVADAALIASGTATLEALLLRRPMVVAYRMAPLTAWIARRMLKVPWFSLPNLLAGKALVPEFSQEQVTAENLGRALLSCLDDASRLAEINSAFDTIHRTLRRNADAAAAAAVLELLQRS
ncbi:MAG: lipid-A-disaccharide synthase [Gammaproteobacteria bacterium]|nr:lipid-A-disaccharide synthase [Gammaproteobacteria bacterium]